VFSLYREGCFRFTRAFLYAKGSGGDVGSLAPGSALDLMESVVPERLLPAPPTLQSIQRLQRATDPLELDRLAAENDGRARDDLEAGIRWLSSMVDARSPRGVRTGRAVRLTVVAVLLVWLAAVIASPGNVALGKPVTWSSTAFGAPSAAVDGDNCTAPYGFHSQDEASPWLTIDLGRPHAISKVKVFGRGDGPFDQSIPLALDFSDDGVSFRTVARRTEPFSQADPWVVTVGLVARFVRLKAERHCPLVVSEVEVYGRPR